MIGSRLTKDHALEHSVSIDYGLNKQLLKQSIKNNREILFHAALYCNFANSEIGELIEQQLKTARLKKITLIAMDFTSIPKKNDWRYEFINMLRHGASISDFMLLNQASINWCEALKASFPEQVNLAYTKQLPTQPILLFEKELWVGSYNYCQYQANQGIWMRLTLSKSSVVSHNSVIFKWLYHGLEIGCRNRNNDKEGQLNANNERDIALYRYIADCRQALDLSL